MCEVECFCVNVSMHMYVMNSTVSERSAGVVSVFVRLIKKKVLKKLSTLLFEMPCVKDRGKKKTITKNVD